jgi:hypothetical protein
MPNNQQIDQTLSYVLKHSPVDEHALSHEGQKLIQDARDIVETAQLMVREKNADELLQNFVWHTRNTDFDRAKKNPDEVKPIDAEKAKADGNEGKLHAITCT